MRKFIFIIVSLFAFINGYSQSFKTLNSDFQLVKTIKVITNEKGKISIAKTDDIYFHLEQTTLYNEDNLIEFWIEIDGEKFNYHQVSGRVVVHTDEERKSKTYFVEDNNFQYCMLMFEPITETWSVDLRTKENDF